MNMISRRPDETYAFGKTLATYLQAGDCLCLSGDLGAGKTLLVQGIAAGLGITQSVTSPTFAIMNVYDGNPPVYHFDLYRLECPSELAHIGFDEYTSGEGIAIIEWPDRFTDCLPVDYIWIALTRGHAEEERHIVVSAHGGRSKAIYEELKQSCS